MNSKGMSSRIIPCHLPLTKLRHTEGLRFLRLLKICFEDDGTAERSLSQYCSSLQLNDALR